MRKYIEDAEPSKAVMLQRVDRQLSATSLAGDTVSVKSLGLAASKIGGAKTQTSELLLSITSGRLRQASVNRALIVRASLANLYLFWACG